MHIPIESHQATSILGNELTYGTSCPFCHAVVSAQANTCGRCRASKSTRVATGGGELVGRFIVWAHTFPLVFLLFGLVALAPWTGNFGDLSLGVGKNFYCEQALISRTGALNTTQLADKRCQEVTNLPATVANEVHAFRQRYPSPDWRAAAQAPTTREVTWKKSFLQRLAHNVVSCAITSAAVAVGLLALLAMSRLWGKIFGRIGDPMWIRR